MRIYLAARYARRHEMQAIAGDLRAMGHQVTSRWINGTHELDDHPSRGERARLAVEDWEDLNLAECCISFTEAPRAVLEQPGRGGRHVEFGAAGAMQQRLILVGPTENVFHWLPWVEHAGTWEQAKALLGWEVPGDV